jgi:uncharacterized protein YbcI
MAISREIVALMKAYMGRGPTHARTYIRDNLVVCVMHDTMSKAEHRVVDNHGETAMRNSRRMLQDGIRGDAVPAVERIVGRPVVSFMSDHDVVSDHVSLVFVMQPKDGEAASHVPEAS